MSNEPEEAARASNVVPFISPEFGAFLKKAEKAERTPIVSSKTIMRDMARKALEGGFGAFPAPKKGTKP